MANASKNKGKAYERVVAKHLSKVTDLNFERVPNSGAFVGGKNIIRTNKLTKEQVDMFEGDIITPAEWDHVRIECKWYKDFSWHHLFRKEGNQLLDGWIEQAEEGTRPYWFLCFKINNCGEYVVWEVSKMPMLTVGTNNISNVMHYKKYIIVTMENFFETNKDLIEKHYREELQNDTDNRNESAE